MIHVYPPHLPFDIAPVAAVIANSLPTSTHTSLTVWLGRSQRWNFWHSFICWLSVLWVPLTSIPLHWFMVVAVHTLPHGSYISISFICFPMASPGTRWRPSHGMSSKLRDITSSSWMTRVISCITWASTSITIEGNQVTNIQKILQEFIPRMQWERSVSCLPYHLIMTRMRRTPPPPPQMNIIQHQLH